MDLFFTLLLKILPLYGLIALAYILAQLFNINREKIARTLIYFIIPLVVFSGVMNADLTLGNISLPIPIFLVAAVISFWASWLGNFFWSDSTKNLLAFTSGSGNTGYFGIPVAVAIFSKEMLSLAVLTTIGIILYENSLGFYHISRGKYSVKDSLAKLAKLPSIWAFIVATVLNVLGIHFGNSFAVFTVVVKDIYVVLGMGMIGLSLAAIKKYKFDLRFLSIAYLNKFILWPILISGLILLDKKSLHIFSNEDYKILFLMSLVPLAANTVVFATELKAHPEKASFAVFLSTIIALIYIPIMVSIFLR